MAIDNATAGFHQLRRNRNAPRAQRWMTAGATLGSMPYDTELADRIRELITAEPGITEQRMFGGLAFLIGGNMAVAASGQGGLLLRADPDRSDELVADGEASVAIMRGRPMPGWLRVPAEAVQGDDQLARWVQVGTSYARSLPAKR